MVSSSHWSRCPGGPVTWSWSPLYTEGRECFTLCLQRVCPHRIFFTCLTADSHRVRPPKATVTRELTPPCDPPAAPAVDAGPRRPWGFSWGAAYLTPFGIPNLPKSTSFKNFQAGRRKGNPTPRCFWIYSAMLGSRCPQCLCGKSRDSKAPSRRSARTKHRASRLPQPHAGGRGWLGQQSLGDSDTDVLRGQTCG